MVKNISLGLLIVAGLILLAFALELGGLKWSKYFKPKKEEVRREVFEETKSYNEGKEQDLVRYRMQFLKADSEGDKEAIASTVRLMFANYDESKLSSELRTFLKEMKYGY